MNILYFANNRLGWKTLEWLRQEGERICGVVVHPPAKRKFGEEILRASGFPPVFAADRIHQSDNLRAIRELRPDIGVSVLFGYILRPALLELFPRGVINLHPALAPFNRGACPNVWSIVERTPAGVTLHYVDKGIDTGDVIAQRPVPVEPTDTGESLYGKLEDAAYHLFCETWPRIRAGNASRAPQPAGPGTFHRTRDLEAIGEIDLSRQYTGRELLDILRARTFPPYPGAWFRDGNRRVNVRVQLEYLE